MVVRIVFVTTTLCLHEGGVEQVAHPPNGHIKPNIHAHIGHTAHAIQVQAAILILERHVGRAAPKLGEKRVTVLWRAWCVMQVNTLVVVVSAGSQLRTCISISVLLMYMPPCKPSCVLDMQPG